jgi:alpha,alpha-trehalase
MSVSPAFTHTAPCSTGPLHSLALLSAAPTTLELTPDSTIKAFETLDRLVPNASTFDAIGIPFDQVAPNQFNLNETELPGQPQSTIGNTSLFTNSTEPWPKQMVIEIANRYMTDAFCSWYSTGGSIPGVLQQLPLSDLNATGTFTPDQAGHMFEKFNATDPDAAGGGGEYTVQIGFGWTNGVVLWAAGRYGQFLPAPTCPLIPIVENSGAGNATAGGNGTEAAAPGDAGTNATDPAGAAGATNATQAMFRGYRIPRK